MFILYYRGTALSNVLYFAVDNFEALKPLWSDSLVSMLMHLQFTYLKELFTVS